MSKAVVAQAYGGPEVLAVVEEEVREPGPGEVLLDVRAIGVNPVEYKVYSGAFGTDAANLPLHLGNEAAGVVRAVGEGARGPLGPIAVGDAVVAYRAPGVYAERAVIPASAVLPKPEALGWDEAAGLLLTGATAFDALHTVRAQRGETVLVHGASGGVGHLAVQLAVSRGVRVVGTAREQNHDYLRSLGAIPVVYGDGLAERVREAAPEGVDAAFDTVGTDEAVDVSLALVPERTRIVTIAAAGRAQSDGITWIGGGNTNSQEIRDRARPELLDAAAAGTLTVEISKTFPLAEAAEAHRELQRSHRHGKFILIP